jgi:chromosome segregation protein
VVQFAKLRLAGFKSFVDPTELEVRAGLTGIVGPNGCGKSNLLEALRWCMGESSARQMRGGGMDDVIFSGTTQRPARNIAEVTMSLDNRDRKAPAAFNDLDEIEVCRRIERESGSSYSVNGREVRAHDVKLLFADVSSGPRSTAIVGQGRVSALIQAKPPERRLLLEEAAGITGLHSRRHEAELKLRAAEQNLARLEDVVVALQNQLQNLKRQARQATRYRNLNDHIRRAEALFLHLRWEQAEQQLGEARSKLAACDAAVRELTSQAAREATALAEAGAFLPGLRQQEADAASERQQHLIEQQAVVREEQRIAEEHRQAERRLEQITADRQREDGLVADAHHSLSRLQEEQVRLAAEGAAELDVRSAAAARLAEAVAVVENLEVELAGLTRKVAADESRRGALERRIAEIEDRIRALADKSAEVATEHARLAAAPVASAGAQALEHAERAFAAAQIAMEAGEAERSLAEAAATTQRASAAAAAEALARLRAEDAGLRAALAATSEHHMPLVESLVVAPGYEAALGAALGEDLQASLEEGASLHWREPAPDEQPPALPDPLLPLARFVEAPPALARRLRQIGVIEDREQVASLSATLVQGQRLVTRAGDLWRWDGLVRRADAPTAATIRLVQRARLRELAPACLAAEGAAREAEQLAANAEQRSVLSFEALRTFREAARRALSDLNLAREQCVREERVAAERQARLDALAGMADQISRDNTEAEQAANRARAELAAIPSAEGDLANVRALEESVKRRRAAQFEQQQTVNRLSADAEARTRRSSAIEQELRSWAARRSEGESRIEALELRRVTLMEEIAQLALRPAELVRRGAELAELAAAAGQRRNAAAVELAEAEHRQSEHSRTLKQVEAQLADAREARGRAEGAVVQCEQNLQDVIARISDRLGTTPDRALGMAELRERDTIPAAAEVERRLERLLHERETMGPVNLRAEEEADTLANQIGTYESERSDLVGAIDRFRRAIAELNREGRDRLLASFEAVNGHFGRIFTRLFGGGRAHLELIEGEDPLDSGLEVMASPPGKKLQSLSLLSGGEQALTALSLLFAVFLTNPAPICILDEVDAPLDDANVDRFCTLVDEIAAETSTRFLIVTHHRMTMARMHRLYGVTMEERGVSRLVSVDLEQAQTLREAA